MTQLVTTATVFNGIVTQIKKLLVKDRLRKLLVIGLVISQSTNVPFHSWRSQLFSI